MIRKISTEKVTMAASSTRSITSMEPGVRV